MSSANQRSVVIVDDEFGLAEMLRDLLGESGYQVALALNGRQALDIVQDRGADLVITDSMMPVMDGWELARTLRGEVSSRGIPIIMMTSLPTPRPVDSGLFDAVLRKPFTPAELLRAMQAVLENRQTARPRHDT